MKNSMKFTFLSAALAILALPVVAQSTNTAAPVTGKTIQQRKENQQDRIAQGVKSGQLTPKETAHLEKKEAQINKEERKDRAANGGKLTPQDKKQITRQQNRESRKIYRAKHNDKVQK